jgi:hypothetical protein
MEPQEARRTRAPTDPTSHSSVIAPSFSSPFQDRKKAYRPNNGKLTAFADGIFSPFCLAGEEVKLDATVSQQYTPGEDKQELMVLKVLQSDSTRVGYADESGVTQCAVLTVPMPCGDGGLTRKVQVSMKFGATEIVVLATDLTSGSVAQLTLSFLDRALDGKITTTTE